MCARRSHSPNMQFYNKFFNKKVYIQSRLVCCASQIFRLMILHTRATAHISNCIISSHNNTLHYISQCHTHLLLSFHKIIVTSQSLITCHHHHILTHLTSQMKFLFIQRKLVNTSLVSSYIIIRVSSIRNYNSK